MSEPLVVATILIVAFMVAYYVGGDWRAKRREKKDCCAHPHGLGEDGHEEV